jgi:hypothetical protein
MRNKSEIILIVVKIDAWDGSALIFSASPAGELSCFPAMLAALAGPRVRHPAML